MQKLYQSCYVSHNETLKPDKRFCYDFVIRMFFHLASFFGSSTADYLVPRPSIPHRGTASVYLLLISWRSMGLKANDSNGHRRTHVIGDVKPEVDSIHAGLLRRDKRQVMSATVATPLQI